MQNVTFTLTQIEACRLLAAAQMIQEKTVKDDVDLNSAIEKFKEVLFPPKIQITVSRQMYDMLYAQRTPGAEWKTDTKDNKDGTVMFSITEETHQQLMRWGSSPEAALRRIFNMKVQ